MSGVSPDVIVALLGAAGSITAAVIAYRASTAANRLSARQADRDADRDDFTALTAELRAQLESTRVELAAARADIRALVAWMREAVPIMRARGIDPPRLPDKFDVY